MKAIEFDEVNVRIAEDQEEYNTLPAYFNKDEGSVSFCFKMTKEQLDQSDGEVWIKMLTFGQPMQPIMVSATKNKVI